MKAEAMLSRGGPVARSLGITRSTYLTVAATSGAIALNGMVAILALGAAGQAAVLAVAFASIACCSAAVSVDVLQRSAKPVSDLRSMGASRASISSALFWSMFSYGALGSALGGLAGAGAGAALLAGTLGVGSLALVGALVRASVAAVGSGAYVGGRMTWRS